MTLRLGEIVLIQMRFRQAVGGKVRPAVVLLDTGDDDFVAAPVTSQPKHTGLDLPIAEWHAAGLNVPSSMRLHKLTVLAKAEIVRSVGILTDTDRDLLRQTLCKVFCAEVIK